MEIKNIKKSFGKRVILDEISVSFPAGLNFIIGDSGEGKSTLLNILGTLDAADSGSLYFSGRKISPEGFCAADYRADSAGFVFQEANLINGLTVFENIDIAAKMGSAGKSAKETDELLKRFNIYEFRDSIVDSLSGGEKQRAALVRALAKNASVILADEPTGSLDSDNSKEVFRCLKEISKDTVVIAVTHNSGAAFRFGDSVFELKNGKLTALKEGGKTQIEAKSTSTEVHNDRNAQRTGPKPPGKRKGSGKRSVIPPCYIRRLTFNNIKRHGAKFISMAAALALVSMLPASLYLMKNCVSRNLESLNTTYYDLDEVDIYPADFSDSLDLSNVLGTGGYFTDDETEKIAATGLFSEIVACPADSWCLDTYEEIDIKPILFDDFFYSRLMGDDIEGDFPSAENEMIIGSDLAQSLFDGDAIGRTLSIFDSYGNEYELKITGINNQSNVDGIFYSYVSADFLTGTVRQPYSYSSCIYLKDNVGASASVSEDASGFTVYELSGGEIIYGRESLEQGEMAVSCETFAQLYSAVTGRTASGLDAENFEEFLSENEDAALVFEKTYYIDGNDCYEISIAAVHNGAEEEILLSQDYYNEINTVMPSVLECYVYDFGILEQLAEAEDIEGYSFYSYYAERFGAVADSSRMMSALIAVMGVLAAALFVIVANSFVKVSVSDRAREVGILKSLGAGKKDLVKLLVSDGFILGQTAAAAAAVLYALFALLLPVITNMYVNSIGVFLAVLIILLIVPGLFCTVTAALKTRRILRESPAETLRRK